MTHGELYYHKRQSIDFKKDISNIARNLERLPKRMKRKEAINYYGQKLRKVFGVEEVSVKDFRHVEDYFDYYEARRIYAKNKGSLRTSR